MQKIKVWDVPTRIFHWTLVLAIAFMWYSAEAGGSWLAWHLRVGLFVIALVVFRICWGFWGSDTARFCQFVRGPSAISRYIKGQFNENEQPGHNPLGALSVLALLAALLVQVITGLFAADENTFTNSGYLNALVSEHVGSIFRNFHVQFFNILLLLIVVHIASVLFYLFVKKHNLVHPMLSGYKYLQGQVKPLRFAGIKPFIAAAAVAAVVVCLILLLS